MQTALLVILVIVIIYLLNRGMQRKFTEESFLAIVNHVFRTPLTNIKWMSDTLAQEIPRKEQIEASQNIAKSVNRLMGILDTLTGIKDINSRASYELRAVSLREILEQAVGKYRVPINEKKITLAMPTLNDMPLLSVDTKKISLVIDVILENAILYSKESGNIKIKAEMKDGYVILSVEDSGLGLSWKDKRNLFKRFYRGERAKKMNTDGMGLGLYVAKEVIKRHHGRIYAKSGGKDKGTVFYITLPT